MSGDELRDEEAQAGRIPEGVPDLETLELWLLGDLYRIANQGRDRRGQGSHVLDPVTGLPADPGFLLSDENAPSGDGLALNWVVVPRQLARVHAGLWAVAPAEWSEEARIAVAEIERRLKAVIRRLAEKGCMTETPPLAEGHEPLPLGGDGYCQAAMFEPKGLKRARKKIPGTVYERGPVSCLVRLDPSDRLRAAEWIQAEFRRENRA
jgi:hypothetical protein